MSTDPTTASAAVHRAPSAPVPAPARRAGPRRPALAAAVTAAVVLAAVLARAAPAAADPPEPVVHRPPVEAPVADPFRAPASRYGPGNRGLAYDPPPGTVVRASASGVVTWAGPVAGTLHVTVLHADGIRTSYSFLEAVSVARGQAVAAGQEVGRAGPGLHFGARDGDAYVDPSGLFGVRRTRVHLVAHREPMARTHPALVAEQAALRDLVATESPGALERLWGAVVDRAAPAADRLRALSSMLLTLSVQLRHPTVVAAAVGALWERHRRECTTPGSTAASRDDPAAGHDDPAARTVVLVAGFGSTSEAAAIDALDVTGLGYDPARVLRFSYEGGRTPPGPGADPRLAGLPTSTYDATDTWGDARVAGRRLADLVEAAAAAAPGARVDVHAHSLGGVVTRLALLELEARGRLDLLGLVTTIGTPHDGADLATVGAAAPEAAALVGAAADALGHPVGTDAPVVGQLATSSDLVAELEARGVPEGVALRTIGARGDLVVPGDRTRVDGHDWAVVDLVGPSAHADLPGDDQVTAEIRLALDGRAPACDGVVEAVLDAVVPETVSVVTAGLGVGALLGGLAAAP